MILLDYLGTWERKEETRCLVFLDGPRISMKKSLTSVVTASDFLDFDDVCAHVSKEHSTGWTGKNPGEVEDSDARKWGRNALVIRLGLSCE